MLVSPRRHQTDTDANHIHRFISGALPTLTYDSSLPDIYAHEHTKAHKHHENLHAVIIADSHEINPVNRISFPSRHKFPYGT